MAKKTAKKVLKSTPSKKLIKNEKPLKATKSAKTVKPVKAAKPVAKTALKASPKSAPPAKKADLKKASGKPASPITEQKSAAVKKKSSVAIAAEKPKKIEEAKIQVVEAEVFETSKPKGILQAVGTAIAKSAVKEKAAKKPKKAKRKKSENAKVMMSSVSLNGGDLEDVNPVWYEFYKKHISDPAQSYDMRATFEANQPLVHKILGWGWIVSNENNRLEVLFKDGKRMLISNYQPS